MIFRHTSVSWGHSFDEYEGTILRVYADTVFNVSV